MTAGYYSFAAIQGKWGDHKYYVVQCPIKLATKIFSFDNSEVPENLRELQSLNNDEVKSVDRYIRGNKQSYVLKALIATIHGEALFESLRDELPELGAVRISLESTLIVCSGQEQQVAIREMLASGIITHDDTISVILIPDPNFERVTTIYMNLNQTDNNRSQKVLAETTELSRLVMDLIEQVPIFQGRIEKTKTTISNRSKSLFTLSAVHQATQALLEISDNDRLTEKQERLAYEYWTELGNIIPEWQTMIHGEVTASELRRNYIHSHTVSLLALGIAGNALITEFPEDWQDRLPSLANMNWSRRNVSLWEGRAMVRGRMSKARDSVTLTVSVIKQTLGLPLTPKEIELEQWIDG